MENPQETLQLASLRFSAEGFRHNVLAIAEHLSDDIFVGCEANSLAEIVLGQTCRTLHTWFNTKFDDKFDAHATELAEASPVARPESVRR